jgi:RNA polymerase sigma-70 factor (ECF subfamily)
MTGDVARAAAEHAARAAYGRLVALLTAPSGDLQLAEDCLATAFVRALATWPDSGVPQNPEAWLLTVARNEQRDAWKSAAHRLSVPLDAVTETPGRISTFGEVDVDAIPDKRLELLFVCAHPAISPDVRAPLMLQAVLGFAAAQVASVFDVPAATMAQRLVRAKRRIKTPESVSLSPAAARCPNASRR